MWTLGCLTYIERLPLSMNTLADYSNSLVVENKALQNAVYIMNGPICAWERKITARDGLSG